MATRSLILKHDDNNNTFTGVYCHWDGYPAGVGVRLNNNYKDPAKLTALFELGDLSMLGPELKDTIAFCRDRCELMSRKFVFGTLDAIKTYLDDSDIEYAHVFQGGSWTSYDRNGGVHKYL